jgi:hypothetical protein
MKQRSDKRVEQEYAEFVATQLALSDRCEVGPVIRTADPLWSGCRGRAQGLHHLRKRSASGALVSRANTLRACNPCNGWPEDFPTLAKAVGLTIIEGHPDWDRLGARVVRQDAVDGRLRIL